MSAIKRWKDKNAGVLASPFWYLKFDYKGRNVREPSGVLIGTKAEEKRTKKEAEKVEQDMRDQIDREIEQAAKEAESGFTRGLLKDAQEKHFHTRIMTGTMIFPGRAVAQRSTLGAPLIG